MMDLSFVERLVASAVEQTGDLIGEHILQVPNFGAVVRDMLRPEYGEMAFVYADCANAVA